MAENPTPSPIIYGSVHDAVTDRLREMMLKGYLEPGQPLQQDELARQLGVSTMPVREALRRLQAEGLVTFSPRRGATVATMLAAEYEEIYRMREELEVLALNWAAQDFSRIPLLALKQILAELEAAEARHDVTRRLQLVRDFFFTIFNTTGKPHLLRCLTGLWDLSQQYRVRFSSIPDIADARLEHYRAIYRACEAHDRQALIDSLRGLYALVRQTLMAILDRPQELEGGE